MIKTQELRLGNWIYPFGSKHPAAKVKELKSYYTDNEMDVMLDTEPIPLTPEILTKCGFETVDQGFEYGDGEQVYRMVTQRGGYLFMILAGHQWCGAAFVKSLHHLQNLMFCLLGYDIKIDL